MKAGSASYFNGLSRASLKIEMAVIMDGHLKIDELKQRGFANFGSFALSQSEVRELVALTDNVLEGIGPEHPDFIRVESGAGGVMRLPQHHPRIAELLDRVLVNATVKSILLSLLGADYKIWQVNLRRSSPGDDGLYLHQDALGETGLCLMLTDNQDGSGATVFLPGSHVLPKRMKEWRIETPPFLIMRLRRLFAPMAGKAGDIGVFFNRTWHGRFSNRSSQIHNVVFISFFPAGHCLGYEGYGDWSAEFLASVQGSELGRLIDPSIGTERQTDGRYKILPTGDATKPDLPYVLAIETDQGQQHRKDEMGLGVSIILLQLGSVVRRVVGPCARVFRKVRGLWR